MSIYKIFLGCNEQLATRLQYAFEKVETMIQSSNKSNAANGNQNLGMSRKFQNTIRITIIFI